MSRFPILCLSITQKSSTLTGSLFKNLERKSLEMHDVYSSLAFLRADRSSLVTSFFYTKFIFIFLIKIIYIILKSPLIKLSYNIWFKKMLAKHMNNLRRGCFTYVQSSSQSIIPSFKANSVLRNNMIWY